MKFYFLDVFRFSTNFISFKKYISVVLLFRAISIQIRL